MSREEFSGIELVPDTIKGVRSFSVDTYGRLTGIHHSQVWTPGENLATCDMTSLERGHLASRDGRTQFDFGMSVIARMMGKGPGYPYSYMATADTYDTAKPIEEDDPRHKFEQCACGFYGYFDGSDDYHGDGTVTAVVEAYGEAVIGTRGFRAKKARIVALRVAPGDDLSPVAARKVERNYSGAGIAFFRTFEDMIREYPADYSHEPSPENDEDFWTR